MTAIGKSVSQSPAAGAPSDSVAREGASHDDAPLCFLHVPKSGGESVAEALRSALPDGAASPLKIDLEVCRMVFSSIDDVEEPLRSKIALSDEDHDSLGDYRFVIGHFTLATMLRVAPPSRIATVLREPRARLLSLYLFFRLPHVQAVSASYCGDLIDTVSRPLDEFLVEPGIASATDNQLCRMILSGDDRIPDDGFIAEATVEEVAVSAVERLDRLGFVGILESGDDMWQGLSQMFGVVLDPRRINESSTPAASADADQMPLVDSAAVFDGLEQRTAADGIVYETLLARSCGTPDSARRRAREAFVDQLARFDRVSATSMPERPRASLAVAFRDKTRSSDFS